MSLHCGQFMFVVVALLKFLMMHMSNYIQTFFLQNDVILRCCNSYLLQPKMLVELQINHSKFWHIYNISSWSKHYNIYESSDWKWLCGHVDIGWENNRWTWLPFFTRLQWQFTLCVVFMTCDQVIMSINDN